MEMKFLKNNRKFVVIFISILSCLFIFLITYLITYNFNIKNGNVNFVNRNKHEVISKNQTKELVIVNQNFDGEILEKNRIKLELSDINKFFTDMYTGGKYEIFDFNDKSIILKEINGKDFEPNMYYIGEKDGYITVFKSDDKGSLFVENESFDISDKKVELLPVSDRELVINYELKSNDREEVQDILSELET